MRSCSKHEEEGEVLQPRKPMSGSEMGTVTGLKSRSRAGGGGDDSVQTVTHATVHTGWAVRLASHGII
jgi:hypothetical protein